MDYITKSKGLYSSFLLLLITTEKLLYSTYFALQLEKQSLSEQDKKTCCTASDTVATIIQEYDDSRFCCLIIRIYFQLYNRLFFDEIWRFLSI